MAAPADTTMRRTLQDLGLHDIYATLAAEEIDDSVFCDLQDGDLKELSISRGNRRKILTAIAALKARERGGWHPPPPPPPLSLSLVRAPSVVTPPRSPPRPVEAADAECSICMDSSVEVRLVGCGHTMCSSCASDWFARTPAGQQTECPTCRGPCTDFEPLRRAPPVPPVPPVEPAVEPATTRVYVGSIPSSMTKLQLAGLFEGVGLVVDAWISKDAKGRSTTMGMVEFSEPAAAAKAVRAWHNKRPYPKGKRLKVALWNKRPPNRRDSFGARERSSELEELRARVEAAERRAEAAEAARARACVAASELTALRGRNELRARAEDAEAASAAATARAAEQERRAARAEANEAAATAALARTRINADLVQKTKELTKAARPNAKLRAENRRLLEQMTGVPTLDPGVSAYVPGVPGLAGPTCWVRCAICRKDADPFTAFSGAELANGAARRCKRCLPGQ